MGALKRGLADRGDELGLYVCGGRGAQSRKTPRELQEVGERTGLDGDHLASTSRLVAKVDSAAVQDGYEIYLHSFVVAADGEWAVVQQGMNDAVGEARRYHWHSPGVADFVDEPHVGIDGNHGGQIINLTDHRALRSKSAQLELIAAGPTRVVKEARSVLGIAEPSQLGLSYDPKLHLAMPAHHDVRFEDVRLRRLHGAIQAAEACGPKDFAELLMVKGVGARTVLSLALVAEVLFGAPHRFSDPARFSFAHGGKDGHPFPVPLDVFDHTIGTLRRAVHASKLGNDDRMAAMKRLDAESRRAEAVAEGASFEALVAKERAESYRYRGRTVDGYAPPPDRIRESPSPKRRPRRGTQLSLL